MKFSLFPILAAVLPLLLQRATPANAAALCLPGVSCQGAVPLHSPPEPRCSTTNGGDSSSTSGTAHHTSPSSSPAHKTTVSIVPSLTPTSSEIHIPTATEPPSDSSANGGDHTATTTITVTGTGGPAPTGTTCSTGPVQCCNSVQSSSSKDSAALLGLLGIVLQGLNVPLGIDCTPISIIGAGSAGTCNAQTVCCENNNFNGLINIGCTPINIGL